MSLSNEDNLNHNNNDFRNSEVYVARGVSQQYSEPICEEKHKIDYRELEKNRKKININTKAYYLISFYAGVSSITELAVSYYFKDVLHIGPSLVGRIMSAIVIPWTLKPLLGLITDFFPIHGYKRKYYIILCGLFAMTCWFMMYLMTPVLSITIALLFTINVCNAFSSVLGEAIVVELSRYKEHDNMTEEDSTNKAKDFISLFMIFKYVGILFASFLKGSLVESIGIQKVFFIGSILPLLVVLAGVIMIDQNVHERANLVRTSETGADEAEQISPNTMAISNEMNNEYTPSFREMLDFVLQKKIIIPIGFIILFMATPSYTDAFFYFLTNELKFTPTSLGQISFCSTIGVLTGIFLYKTFFKDAVFKKVLIICSILNFTFTFCAYLLVLRVNIKYGISDFILVLLSNSMLSMLGEIMLLPLLSLACILCPKNMEGTIFSVFMSALNLGGVLSSLSGSWLISLLEITATDFKNLHTLIFITNVIGLLPLPLLYFISNSYFKH